MAGQRIRDFAAELAKRAPNTTVDSLMTQLKEAGVNVTGPDQLLTAEDKRQLLRYLRTQSSVGAKATTEKAEAGGRRITLRRRSSIETIKQGGKTVMVETRPKKKIIRKRPQLPVEPEPELETAPEVSAETAASLTESVEAIEAVAETPSVAPGTPEAEISKEVTAPEAIVAAAAPSEAQPSEAEAAPSITEAETELTTPSSEAASARKGKAKVAKPEPGAVFEESFDEDGDLESSARKKKKKGLKKVAPETDRLSRKSLSLGERPGRRRKRKGEKRAAPAGSTLSQGFERPTAPVVKVVMIPESIIVADLAKKLSVKPAEIIKILMKMGAMATINERLDQDTAMLVVEEMGHQGKPLQENALEESLETSYVYDQSEAVTKPPVVTIMGHVDHGKTSLLDYIRRSKVTAQESGGITQHIGAYQVDTGHGLITFLDTPGHEAFTAMRARGAKCTDIVILVVAADDGVMPQTIEAIQHAKAANVPIIVAVNKIDKPESDPERVTSELSRHGVIAESWGGDTMFQPISAKTGEGIDQLLENILLQAEVLELKAVPKGPARGLVIESRLDKRRGPVATVLITAGTLNVGDVVLAGAEYGRIRAMIGDDAQPRKTAQPATPVELLGLSGAPMAGDELVAVPDERKAREVAQFRQGKYREVRLSRQQTVKLDNLFDQFNEGKQTVLTIVLKADVQGSLEAISESLLKLSTDEVKVNIVASGLGGITESDVNLAIASSAIILGFNVRADVPARQLVEREKVDLHYYSVIYDLIDEVKSAMTGLLAPEYKEVITGIAQVRDVFRSSKLGAIAGCMVTEGLVKRHLPIRVLRDNVVIYEGELESLRRFKEDVSDVRQGMECGIGVKHYNDVKAGDQIEVYEKIRVERAV